MLENINVNLCSEKIINLLVLMPRNSHLTYCQSVDYIYYLIINLLFIVFSDVES